MHANDHEASLLATDSTSFICTFIIFYNGSEKRKTKRDSLSSGQHIPVTENEIWMNDACVRNELMITVSRIIKKGLIQRLDGLFFPHLPSIFGHSNKQAAPTEMDKIYIYISPWHGWVQYS